MIINHRLKIIFIRPKKVAGTSFEIALSKYCDRDDIITFTYSDDRKIRKELGFISSVNWSPKQRERKYSNTTHVNRDFTGTFHPHITSKEIRHQIGQDVFEGYTKIAIHRDPLDLLVSLYFWSQYDQSAKQNFKRWLLNKLSFWSRHDEPFNKNFKQWFLNRLLFRSQHNKSFRQWFLRRRYSVFENYRIAPLVGPYKVDGVIRYEALESDIKKISALPDDFYETFRNIHAKGHHRPQQSKDGEAFFVQEGCGEFIKEIRALSEAAQSIIKGDVF